jgi:hypothetical protein
VIGKLLKLLGKLFGKLLINHDKPLVEKGKKTIFSTQERTKTPINSKVNLIQKQSKQKIITARPDGMSYEEYRIIRKTQNQNIKNYLHGHLVVEMIPSDRRERRERSRLSTLFFNAEKPYHFHPHLYHRLKNVRLLLPAA